MKKINPEDGRPYYKLGNVTLDPVYGTKDKYTIQVDNYLLEKTEILNGHIQLRMENNWNKHARGA